MPPSTLLFDEYPQVADLEDLAAWAEEEEEEEDYRERLEEEDHLVYLPHNWSPSRQPPTSSNLDQDQLSLKETDNWPMHSSGKLTATSEQIKEYPDSTHPSEKWPSLSHILKDLKSMDGLTTWLSGSTASTQSTTTTTTSGKDSSNHSKPNSRTPPNSNEHE